MKSIEELLLPEELHYTKEHIWIKKDGESFVAGISDYAQDQLGEVVYVDLNVEGKHLTAGEEFGSVESVKSVNALFMPVNGTVEACNADMEDTPSLVNVSCYDKGWLVRIRPDNPADVDALLDAAGYKITL